MYNYSMAKFSASEARANFNRVLELAKTEAVEIQKHGKPSAIILSAMDYDKLIEYIEDLEDSLTVMEFEADPKAFGKSTPLEEVERELGLKPL